MVEPSAPWTGPLAACLLLGATPVVAWWAIGDRSADTPDPIYFIRPPEIDPGLERSVGVAALVVMVAAAALLVNGVRRGRFDGRWSGVVLPLFAAAALIGAGGRSLTAGMIPDGFAWLSPLVVIAIWGPVVAALLVLALASGLGRRREPRT